VRDAQWYRDDAQLKREQPFCVKHLERGEQVVATQTDHIKPLIEGGTNHRSNLQRLCDECHEVKTLAEQNARYVY
jgi:5-methylcytosine-specific restriction protein A